MEKNCDDEKERTDNEDEASNNSNAGDLVWLSFVEAFN